LGAARRKGSPDKAGSAAVTSAPHGYVTLKKAVLAEAAEAKMKGLVSAGLIAVFGGLRRSFDLFRADLANQWIGARDLKRANLGGANLKGTYLPQADLQGAILYGAHLDGANHQRHPLRGASRRLGAPRQRQIKLNRCTRSSRAARWK